MRRTAIALALGAVASCAGLAVAGDASADTIGFVYLPVHGNDTNAKAHWGEAWDMCQNWYPTTRSIHYQRTEKAWPPGTPETAKWVQEWTCDDKS
jgi:hypothetical protein